MWSFAGGGEQGKPTGSAPSRSICEQAVCATIALEGRMRRMSREQTVGGAAVLKKCREASLGDRRNSFEGSGAVPTVKASILW